MLIYILRNQAVFYISFLVRIDLYIRISMLSYIMKHLGSNFVFFYFYVFIIIIRTQQYFLELLFSYSLSFFRWTRLKTNCSILWSFYAIRRNLLNLAGNYQRDYCLPGLLVHDNFENILFFGIICRYMFNFFESVMCNNIMIQLQYRHV